MNTDIVESGSDVLVEYYRPDTIKSDLAREVFLMPDLATSGSVKGGF